MKRVILLSLILFQSLAAQEKIVLTLPEAISRALCYNRSYLAAGDQVTAAEWKLILSEYEFDWHFRPHAETGFAGGGEGKDGFTVGAGFDVSKKFSYGPCFSFSPTVYYIDDSYHSNFKVAMKFPLLRRWGQEYNLSHVKGAEYYVRTARRSLLLSQIQTVLRTIKSLYDLVKQEETLLLNEDFSMRWDQYAKAAEAKEKLGFGDKLDTYRAQNELKTAKDQVLAGAEKLEELQDALRDLLALPWQVPLSVDLPLDYKSFEIFEEQAIQTAFCSRLELQQARDDFQEKIRLMRLSKKHLMPDLNLVMNYKNCGRDQGLYRSCFEVVRDESWGVGVTTSSDFNRIEEKASYNQTLLALEAAERNLEQIKSHIILEVKSAIRQLKRSEQKISTQEEKEKLSAQEVNLVSLKYEKGLADYYEIIHAEKKWHQAKLGSLCAVIDALIAQYQVLFSMGLLLEGEV